MKYEISVERTFSAAHALREYKGKCENLHGHNWRIRISVTGQKLDKMGMLVDFTDLKSALDAVLKKLDHTNLNELNPFNTVNPTAENIAAYIYEGLKKYQLPQIKISSVEVWESEKSSAKYSE
jgi:6-pyruvoyltetrahydropterin/6-carboxytetrahydropterin synthase